MPANVGQSNNISEKDAQRLPLTHKVNKISQRLGTN